ncbi:hypothetical protein PFDG_04360 [Plasmodium falciparum Dd2]|uniref:26S proteasome non-ATPase regulatory subunit 3 N-terminal TPR repeats domain-containing protein n=1 Tax=Plasmodium falciparum (isolate Dd2) TaxID=57267 RepID=A0A0L7M505_PLAF4|nr:hypothetical protein PFDG_04360 [Plasmodium falciparum Dd2]
MKDKHKKVEYAEKDVEIKEIEKDDGDNKVFVNNLLTSVNYINNAIVHKDNRHMLRMLKYIKNIRLSIKNDKNMSMPIIIYLIKRIFKENYPIYNILNKYMNIYEEGLYKEISDFYNINEKTYMNCLPELEVFFYLLILLYLLDEKCYDEGMELSTIIINRINKINRRSLDYINAKVYFYYSWIHELGGKLSQVRQKLLFIYRNACLHRDIMTQTVVVNLILRDYIKHNLYDLAVRFIRKILAVQLDYSEAHRKITQALRKAPQHTQSAKGFKLAATKMEIVVELLMGDIPDRSIFSNKIMYKKLIPYKHVVSAVRNGDINKFAQVMNNYTDLFIHDGVYLLIKRIHHNVIKTALRIINLSYSRISIVRKKK